MERTAEEVGKLIRARRESLGLAQQSIDGISSSTIGIIERGTSRAGSQRGLTMAALFRALGWPPDTYQRLMSGEDPAALDEVQERQIEVDASSVDLDELRRLDPDAYDLLMTMARSALDRANGRRHS